ncbi:MAG: ABC transporter permease [Muribaculaceae bacterium]|nr:ABC transporter permease [Muribaculaceae bacterium]
MSLPLYLAKKIPLSIRRSKSGGIGVAVTGIALSVIVMVLSVSIMSGFRDEIRHKITGFDSQLTVLPRGVPKSVSPWISASKMSAITELLPEGISADLTMRQPAIMKSTDDFSGVVVKGAGAHDKDFLKDNMVKGVIPDYSADSTLYQILVSSITASSLGLDLGDRIDTYFMGGDVYRARRLKIAGIYDTHFSDYDRHIVYASMPMLRNLVSMPDSAGMLVEINGLSDEQIDPVASNLSDRLLQDYYSDPTGLPLGVSNIHHSAALYFNWLALLDTNVAIILSLMALLSALTLISALFILTLRRVNMIGILKAIGASNRLVRQTFILMALRILTIGLLIGDAVSLSIILLQRSTRMIPLNPEAYYLDHVPMALEWGVILQLNIAIFVFSFLILLLPSGIIATISPSRAINYE